MDTIEQLLQRGQQAQGGGVAQALLSATEAERIIDQLAPLTIEEVGGPKWHAQHEWIERLNLQAHYNAQTHSDEFIVELLVSLDKLHVLVHDLLLIEAWKEFVYPLLAAHLAEAVDSVTTYLLLYHEVTVTNLLQVALYYSHAAESLSEDYALELADWCSRKLTRLNAEGHKMAEQKDRAAEELLRMSRLDEQEEKRREVEFSVMMCSLAILRYVTDSLPRLPMGALSRVVSTNDTLMGLLPLLDRPPWVRTRVPGAAAAGGKGGRPVLEKWAGNRWAVVPPADRLKITQTDGQVWLAVTNLLVEPRCRAKYGMDEFRRERILGLKRHLNELMFDQLPVLKDLQRAVDELALGGWTDPSGAGKTAALILEAVPVVRDAMLRGRNWRAVAERARQDHFGRAAASLARERMEAMVKHLDYLCEMEPESAAGAAAGEGGAAAAEPPPPVKISTWRKVHDSGVFESWYDFSMEVDDSRPPEPVEVAAANAGASGAAGGKAGSSGRGAAADGGGGAVVHGLRYRLRPLDVDGTRPLPADGKAVVRWGSLVSEALLRLPELPTRDSSEGAAVLWVTVGLLAVDGLVLQIKLKKAPKPKERDRAAGVWYAYHPVAGALTVLRDHAASAAAGAAGGGSSQQLAADGKGQIAAGRGSAAAASSWGVEGSSAGSSAGKGGGSSGARPLVQVIADSTTPEAESKKATAAASAAAKGAAAAVRQVTGDEQRPEQASAEAGRGEVAAATATAVVSESSSRAAGPSGGFVAQVPTPSAAAAMEPATEAPKVVPPAEAEAERSQDGDEGGSGTTGAAQEAGGPAKAAGVVVEATEARDRAPALPSQPPAAAEVVGGEDEADGPGLDDPE